MLNIGGVEFLTRSRGKRRIRHCTYWVTGYIMSSPSNLRLIFSSSSSNSILPPSVLLYPTLSLYLRFFLPLLSPISATACPDLIPRISRAGCSHHLCESCTPGIHSAISYNSMIGQVTMYCAAVFVSLIHTI